MASENYKDIRKVLLYLIVFSLSRLCQLCFVDPPLCLHKKAVGSNHNYLSMFSCLVILLLRYSVIMVSK